MDDLEVKAEVFRVVRAYGDYKSANYVYKKIKEHLGGTATDEQIGDALKYLWDKVK